MRMLFHVEYAKMKKFKHGHSGYTNHRCRCDTCIEMYAAYKKKWGLENKDEISLRHAEYYLKHRDVIRSRSKKRYYSDPDSDKNRSLIWHRTHPKETAAIGRKWRQSHPDKQAAHSAMHRANKLKSAPPWLTRGQYKQIESFYKESRRLTKETGEQYSVDHIWPLKGKTCHGLHVPWNLRVITFSDNCKKKNSMPISSRSNLNVV